MKAALLAVAAAIATGASASHLHAGHHHGAFHVARGGYNDTLPPTNATYGCGECGEYTVWVTTYGEPTLHHEPAPHSTKSASTSSCSSTSTHVTPAAEAYTSKSSKSTPPSTHAYVAPTSVAPVYSSSSSSSVYAAVASPVAQSYSSGSYSVGGSSNKWAITYTPYTSSGACKGASDVAADLAKIKAAGFTTIRTYSTDCNGLETISAGCNASGLKLIVGIFISGSGCSGAQEQVNAIVSWKQWGLVDLVIIGNEAIMSGYTSAGELASFISSTKAALRAAGYNGPCTTTEPMSKMIEFASVLCPVIDIAGANIHAFFNSATTASLAGVFVAGQLEILGKLCPGKSAINLESGWPNAGSSCNGAACPGPGNQYTALHAIMNECGSKSVLFSYTDDPWKPSGTFGVEQHWGAFDGCLASA